MKPALPRESSIAEAKPASPLLPRSGDLALRCVLLACLFVGAFPHETVIAKATLDGSWVAELNRLTAAGRVGGHWAFPYGPLGWILHPIDVGAHLEIAALARFAAMLAFVGLVFSWTREASLPRLGALCVANVVAVSTGLFFEYQLVVLAVLLACIAIESSSRPAALALAVFAGAAFFVKLTLGVSACGALAAAAIGSGRHETTTKRLREGVVLGATALAAFVAAGLLLVGPPPELLAWARLSLEIASGYAEAMSFDQEVPFSSVHVALGALAVVASLAASVLSWPHPISGRAAFWVGTVPLFLAFKHAFVQRTHAHGEMFFPFALVVVSLAAVRSGRLVALCLTATASVLAAFSLHSAHHYGVYWQYADSTAGLTGAHGIEAVRKWATPHRLKWDALDSLVVPRLAETLGGQSVGVFPIDVGLCLANGLDCEPMPTLQTYSAYTATLDEMTGERLSGASRPTFLFVSPSAVMGKTSAWEAPATWRAIVQGYVPAPIQPGPLFLLKRAEHARRPVLESRGQYDVALDRWNPVLGTGQRRYLSLDFELTPLGHLWRLLYRIPEVVLVVRYDDGAEFPARIVPSTARNGIAIDDHFEAAEEQAAMLLIRRRPRRATAVGLTGRGLRWYREPVRATWLEEAAAPAGTSTVVPTFPSPGAGR